MLDAKAVPADVMALLRTLRAAGKQAWLAGGAVRDLLLGKVAQDFDVATDALPEQVVKLFPRVVPTGMQHGTVTVVTGEHNVEVTTFRGEGPYLDGRRPSAVTFLGDIDGDLARRDFTVNAMAWDPIDGVLRLKFPRRETERVALLVAEHNWHFLPEWNDATVRRVLARIGPAELPALWGLRRADLKARGRLVEEGLANQAEAEVRFQREIDRAAALKVSDLAIRGEDVMRELHIGPGREVGEVLARLLERVIDDPDLNTREALLRLLPEVTASYPQ